MILADTSGVFSALDRSQPGHEAARRIVEAEDVLILSPFVLAELDYLLATRISVTASLELLRDVRDGAYELASISAAEVGEAASLVERYESLGVGLTDASIVVLAARYDTKRVLTFDERHFRALRTKGGGSFTLAPADG